jgi:hypothetical protein
LTVRQSSGSRLNDVLRVEVDRSGICRDATPALSISAAIGEHAIHRSTARSSSSAYTGTVAVRAMTLPTTDRSTAVGVAGTGSTHRPEPAPGRSVARQATCPSGRTSAAPRDETP